MNQTWSGGCQCGAVRYRFTERPGNPSICHCRMCQKAFGNFYAPLVYGPAKTFEITRGTPATFMSSEETERGFCRDCGTPLTFRYLDTPYVSVAIGSLDLPAEFPPEVQYGIESRIPWVNQLGVVADARTTEDEDGPRAKRIASSNRQHPDHDTDRWPE